MTIPVKHEKETALSHRWPNPFEQMDRWFHGAMPQSWMHPFRRSWMEWPGVESAFENRMLNVDVVDREKEILVRAELPGVEKDNIDISLDGQQITIKASSQQEEEKEDGDYYHHEINRGEFRRSFALPAKVDGDKAKSTFKDGVIEMILPKSEPSKRRKIKVE